MTPQFYSPAVTVQKPESHCHATTLLMQQTYASIVPSAFPVQCDLLPGTKQGDARTVG